MRQRVGIAAALASNPDILIADEPSTALDVTTQKEILKLLRSIQEQRNMALVLITHDLRVAFSMCDRIYVLYAGSVLEVAPAAELEQTPLHPYSLALLLAEPPLDRRLASLTSVQGAVPPPDEVASSCTFSPRCDFATAVCEAASPPLVAVGEGRLSACVRIEQIRTELASARAVAAEEAAPVVAPARPGETPVVRVDRVSKSFGPVTALQDVSIEVYPGESVGLVGESGSGKSTLARCLLGLERVDRGTITIGGLDASNYAAMRDPDRQAVRGTIQMIFQDPYSSLNPTLSVGSTLREALAVSKSTESVAELLDRVNLPASYAARKPAALSGGERQRVAIARALAVQPKLIVCDEPVSALDVSVQAQVLTLFRQVCDDLGIGYLFITHDLAVVRQVVDRVYVLHRGAVVEQGEVATVLADPKDDYTRRLVASVPRNEPDWLTT
jgi:peptide/nickel transport system ATP-binding protein